jgi:hypothetical protein
MERRRRELFLRRGIAQLGPPGEVTPADLSPAPGVGDAPALALEAAGSWRLPRPAGN